MVPTPGMRSLVTAVLLGCVLGGAPAGADGGLSCRDCGALPEEYTVDITRCQAPKPVLWGEPAKGPPGGVSYGRFFDFDLAGDGSRPVRVWVGVGDTGPFFVVFDGSTHASVCGAIGSFEQFEDWGGMLDVKAGDAGLPHLSFSSYHRISYCGNLSARAEVAYLQLQKTWVILAATSDSGSSMCVEEGKPDPAALEWKRQKGLHAAGVKAYKQGDFATAERLWRKVEASGNGTASSDLGLLLLQQGRAKEAEPRMLSSADMTSVDFPSTWLNLADFYWVVKQRAWAARAYRRYLFVMNHPWRRKRGPNDVPVSRAVQRAAPAPENEPLEP